MSTNEVIAKLTEMGFDPSDSIRAVGEAGPSLDNAIDYILNQSRVDPSFVISVSSNSCRPVNTNSASTKRAQSLLGSSGKSRQSSILDHFHSSTGSKLKRSRVSDADERRESSSETDVLDIVNVPEISPRRSLNSDLSRDVYEEKESLRHSLDIVNVPEPLPACADVSLDWELRANAVLQKHFGYSSLKGFQKEALNAWALNKDCVVLAATGSGKSLCFQIPALLTGKVVVVVSPLISLMHDQCLKLSKHGVSACFLGSGQTDNSVEHKAMKGVYDIIYVCPETILRLVKPLQRLAENRGIALFAIDEAHCVSKWGHDFRPDYRKLSILRENFCASTFKVLQYDIPLMALTATATVQVQEDILKSLNMSKETKVVLTSFFRPNLQFSVKHSRTSPSSYEKDFRLLIDLYSRKKKENSRQQGFISKEYVPLSDKSAISCSSVADWSSSGYEYIEDDCSDIDDDDDNEDNGSNFSDENKMSVEYLENEVDVFEGVDDWDVACGGFSGQVPCQYGSICQQSETDPSNKPEERLKLLKEPFGEGPTIIYVPTRKQTLSISKYLCNFGVRAAAYNAALPKSHLRRVHKEFHDNLLQVVVATIAFGMGIDKSNVRRIIHYGWPQSLEAYYQEAGRAGRDGKLAECILYANLSRTPTLLPSRRSEEQTKQAYKMLADCFRYGMNTSCCRSKALVQYFGEDFACDKCLICDICNSRPPQIQNLKEEASILMQIIASCYESKNSDDSIYDDYGCGEVKRITRTPSLVMLVTKVREQARKFLEMDRLWWQGLARIMESKGFIRESDEKIKVQIKYPEPTKQGLKFLQNETERPFYAYPEADMLLSMKRKKPYSTFAEWGKGWADPEIRCKRLERLRERKLKPKSRQPWMKKSGKLRPDLGTSRGRIAAKLLKH